MREADVLIIGGGVIGLSLARELARRNAAVTVVTRDAPGSGASATAAGMLEVHFPLPLPPALDALCGYSRSLYARWAADLKNETGVDVGLDECGTLAVARDRAELETLEAAAAALPNARVLRRPEDWRRFEPRLPDGLTGALPLPDDHHVDPRKLCEALLLGLERARVPIVRGATITSLLADGGRIAGAVTDAGEFRARWTVLAAGAWAGTVPGAPDSLPVRPVKGQLLVLHTEAPPALVLQAGHLYLVPRPRDGRVVVGATVEEAGYDVRPTAAGVAELLAGALRLLPALAAARFVEVRVGLRPGTPDELPILGAASREGLVYAAGHFRKGILLAPGTASLLADVIGGGRPAVPLESFAAARFAHAHAVQR